MQHMRMQHMRAHTTLLTQLSLYFGLRCPIHALHALHVHTHALHASLMYIYIHASSSSGRHATFISLHATFTSLHATGIWTG